MGERGVSAFVVFRSCYGPAGLQEITRIEAASAGAAATAYFEKTVRNGIGPIRPIHVVSAKAIQKFTPQVTAEEA